MSRSPRTVLPREVARSLIEETIYSEFPCSLPVSTNEKMLNKTNAAKSKSGNTESRFRKRQISGEAAQKTITRSSPIARIRTDTASLVRPPFTIEVDSNCIAFVTTCGIIAVAEKNTGPRAVIEARTE